MYVIYTHCQTMFALVDIAWTEHSTLTTSRHHLSSVVMQDTLYLLGHRNRPASRTTEELSAGTMGVTELGTFQLRLSEPSSYNYIIVSR